MKIALKLIIAAVFSLSIGIAAATPLMLSELTIRPRMTQVQGPTADFDFNVAYANFTVQNPDAPITENSGPIINYFAVVNVTNPSEYPVLLQCVDFWVGEKITDITGKAPFGMKGNWRTGGCWEAKGAWVDGVWYNVTWVDGSYPVFDENGVMTQSPFPNPETEGYWIEGVQLYRQTVYTDAGTTTSIYMNMNGTWTDVTGKITVDYPENGPTYSMTGSIADYKMFFQEVPAENFTFNDESFGYITIKNILAGDDAFDNVFASGQSRLIVVTGSWEVCQSWTFTVNPVEVLKAGNLQLKISVHNAVDMNPYLGNNTYLATWSDATVFQQLSLLHIGNSYIYNTALSENEMFLLDQYGVEATIVPRS
jgi:hypothetical protein